MPGETSFEDKFRLKLWKEAEKSIEKDTTPLEKDMLEQHRLLREAVFVPYTSCKDTFDPLVLIEGTGQGVANIEFSEELAREAVTTGKAKPGSVFIPSGAIGVRKEKYKDTGTIGINAEVLAQMHNVNQDSKDRIIIEGESLNTPEQAQKLNKILDKNGFSKAVLIMSPWHAPRFFMTMVKEMPDVDFYSHYFWRDKDNISGAPFDYGIARFQAPLLLAEIARLHRYIEEGSGPCSVMDLKKYIINLLEKNNINPAGKNKLFEELVPNWDKSHREILKHREYEGFRK